VIGDPEVMDGCLVAVDHDPLATADVARAEPGA
jgi:hypothetical protein